MSQKTNERVAEHQRVPRVVTLADLRHDEPDGNAEMAVADGDLMSEDGRIIAVRGTVLFVQRQAARGQSRVHIYGEQHDKFVLANGKVRRLGLSWNEFMSDTMAPAGQPEQENENHKAIVGVLWRALEDIEDACIHVHEGEHASGDSIDWITTRVQKAKYDAKSAAAQPTTAPLAEEEPALRLARHVLEYPRAARGMGDREHALWAEREALAREVLDDDPHAPGGPTMEESPVAQPEPAALPVDLRALASRLMRERDEARGERDSLREVCDRLREIGIAAHAPPSQWSFVARHVVGVLRDKFRPWQTIGDLALRAVEEGDIEMAKGYLRMLAERPADPNPHGWRPVTETEPAQNVLVIGQLSPEDARQLGISVSVILNCGTRWVGDDVLRQERFWRAATASGWREVRPIAWQPLPAPADLPPTAQPEHWHDDNADGNCSPCFDPKCAPLSDAQASKLLTKEGIDPRAAYDRLRDRVREAGLGELPGQPTLIEDVARRAAIGLLRTYWLHSHYRLDYRSNADAVLEALRVLAPDLAQRWDAGEGAYSILGSIGALGNEPTTAAQPAPATCARTGCGKPVAYDGAVYCGAACTVMAEEPARAASPAQPALSAEDRRTIECVRERITAGEWMDWHAPALLKIVDALLVGASAAPPAAAPSQDAFWIEAARVLGQALNWRYDFADIFDKRRIFEDMVGLVAQKLRAEMPTVAPCEGCARLTAERDAANQRMHYLTGDEAEGWLHLTCYHVLRFIERMRPDDANRITAAITERYKAKEAAYDKERGTTPPGKPEPCPRCEPFISVITLERDHALMVDLPEALDRIEGAEQERDAARAELEKSGAAKRIISLEMDRDALRSEVKRWKEVYKEANAYAARLRNERDDMQVALREARAEAERLSKAIHPWYGPCDALAGGECSECDKLVNLGPWDSPWNLRAEVEQRDAALLNLRAELAKERDLHTTTSRNARDEVDRLLWDIYELRTRDLERVATIAAQDREIERLRAEMDKVEREVESLVSDVLSDPGKGGGEEGGVVLPGPQTPLTQEERAELADLRRKVEDCGMGDRPHAPAVVTLRRLAQLEARLVPRAPSDQPADGQRPSGKPVSQ